MTGTNTLPTFAEIAARRIADAGPRDKTINVKVAINTARMMVEAEQRAVNCHDDLVKALTELRDLVRSGEMPAYGGLPQVDLVSRSYVTLASAVETICDAALSMAR